jgi:N6-adenosine-specific RNA methylase IME4
MPAPREALFASLPQIAGGFGAAIIDLPLKYASNSDAKPGRNARRFCQWYRPEAFRDFRIAEVTAEDSSIFTWAPGPFLPDIIGLIRAWNFKYSSVAFVWVKLKRNASTLFFTEDDLHLGLGHTTRHNAEACLLARRGKCNHKARDVPEVIIAPVREHSRKPDEAYARIERLVAGPCLDVFGRQSRSGWVTYGHEATKFDTPQRERFIAATGVSP